MSSSVKSGSTPLGSRFLAIGLSLVWLANGGPERPFLSLGTSRAMQRSWVYEEAHRHFDCGASFIHRRAGIGPRRRTIYEFSTQALVRYPQERQRPVLLERRRCRDLRSGLGIEGRPLPRPARRRMDRRP